MSALPRRLVLLGHPVSHSLSPVFQNAALEQADLAMRYEAVDVRPADLERVVAELRNAGAAGNVTVPHKERFAALCDETTVVASRAGAVNCFRVDGGALVGHNTDVAGVRVAVEALVGVVPRGVTFGVLGAGGAAAAVLAAVENWSDCSAIVSNRDTGRRDALVARFGSVARSGDAAEIARRADIVVNATTLGLSAADSLPIAPDDLRGDCAVLDLVYSRNETALVHAARRRGLKAADGLGMLIAQGAAAFEWWLGISPDIGLMWRSVGRRRP